jgi:hypothetical protein
MTKEHTFCQSSEIHQLLQLILPSSLASRSLEVIVMLNVSDVKEYPGPGKYEPLTGMNKTGSYFVSKFLSTMCRTHYHADRRTFDLNNVGTPGPGNYRLPSDFGQYEAKNTSSSVRISARMTKSASQPALGKGQSDQL